MTGARRRRSPRKDQVNTCSFASGVVCQFGTRRFSSRQRLACGLYLRSTFDSLTTTCRRTRHEATTRTPKHGSSGVRRNGSGPMCQLFRFLSNAEFDTVLKRASAFEGETSCRGKTAAGTILGLHGLRCGEVCGLRVNDLDTAQGALFVATLKKGRRRAVEIEPRFAQWLGRLARGAHASATLLRTCRGRALDTSHFRRAWHRLSMRWLGRTVNFHALRHTAAMRLFESTKDLLAVQKFLGHKSLASTQVYLSSGASLRDHMPRMPSNDAFQPLLYEAG